MHASEASSRLKLTAANYSEDITTFKNRFSKQRSNIIGNLNLNVLVKVYEKEIDARE